MSVIDYETLYEVDLPQDPEQTERQRLERIIENELIRLGEAP